MKKYNIPAAVVNAAKDRESLGRGFLALVGVHNGAEVFSFIFDEPLSVGLPEPYVWDGHSVSVVSGLDAEKLSRILKTGLLTKNEKS